MACNLQERKAEIALLPTEHERVSFTTDAFTSRREIPQDRSHCLGDRVWEGSNKPDKMRKRVGGAIVDERRTESTRGPQD